MSDLQISLLIIGAVVVGGVYLFNRLQERRFRRSIGKAFDKERDDVLLKAGRGTAERVEPQIQQTAGAPAAASSSAEVRHEVRYRVGPAAAEFDSTIDYVVTLDGDTPFPGQIVDELLSRIGACGKPCRAAGSTSESGPWEDIARGAGDRYRKLMVALQLVNRAGPVNPAQLAMFCDAARSFAEKTGARASCPDTQEALRAARELDRLCADVDVAIGVNVVAADGQLFPGSMIRMLAEAAGFKLEPDGVFHYRNAQRQTLFTLDNHEPAPFLPEQVKNLSTGGITLLLDVPRVADGSNVLDRMLEVARGLAQSLGGQLVDDNRVALDDTGIARIRQQAAQIYAAMDAHGVGAGSARALRLFA
ncbi:MAG: cell division protein FtsZ [Betaproteobacteria bacterium]|nr:cell division protein FtsZ [Betaproteobacteria bacterium]